MKKAVSILIIISVIISLCGCGSSTINGKIINNSYNDFQLDGIDFQASSDTVTSSQVVNIDINDVINESFTGYGLEFDPYIWVDLSEERWEQIKKWLAWSDMGVIRSMLNGYLFCLGFDQNGEPKFVWDYVDEDGNQIKNSNGVYTTDKGQIINHNAKSMQKMYDVLDFCEENKIEAIVGDWAFPAAGSNIYPGADLLKGKDISYTDGRWQKMLAGLAKHLNEKYPDTVKYLDEGNEVNLSPDQYEVNSWTESIKTLYAECEKAGIADKVQIIGPDGGFTNDLWLNSTLNVLTDEVAHLDYHYYFNKNSASQNFIENTMRIFKNTISREYPDKKAILSEMGYSALQNAAKITEAYGNEFSESFVATSVADGMVQLTRAGIDSSLLWMVDDATHVAWGDIPTKYVTEADTIWKYGGLWNSNGTAAGYPEKENPKPMYYSWATLSRAFPKGSKIVYTNNPDDQAARTLAAVFDKENGKGKDISIALVNSSDQPVTVTFKCNDVKNKVDLMYYEYTADSIPMTEDLCPKEKDIIKNADLKSGVEIKLAASGTVVLTTKDTDSSVEINENPNHIVDNMGSLSNMYANTSNLGFNGFDSIPSVINGDVDNNSYLYNGDDTRIHRSDDNTAYIIYNIENLKDFRLGFYQKYGISGGVRLYVSSDYKEWELIDTEKILKTTVSDQMRYNMLIPSDAQSIPEGTKYIKIELDKAGEIDDTQLTYFEAANEKLPPLTLLGAEQERIYVKTNAQFTLSKEIKLRFTGEYVGEYSVNWDNVNSFSDTGIHYVNGKIDGTDISVFAEIYVTESLYDELDDYSLMAEYPVNLKQSGASMQKYNGDLTQLVRKEKGEGEINYKFCGASAARVELFLFQPVDEISSYIKVFYSADGKKYTETEVSLKEIKENDSTGVYGINEQPRYVLSDEEIEENKLWPLYVFDTAKMPNGTNYVKFVLTDKANTWIQQLKSVTVE